VKPIKSLLKDKKIEINTSSRPINLRWEIAEEFGKAVDLKTAFIMKLFRDYGQDKVLGLRSWLGDLDADPKKVYGLVVWKLNGGKSG